MAQLTLSVVPETKGFFSTLAHLGPKDFLKSHLIFKADSSDFKKHLIQMFSMIKRAAVDS
jgi:hypothetical protein